MVRGTTSYLLLLLLLLRLLHLPLPLLHAPSRDARRVVPIPLHYDDDDYDYYYDFSYDDDDYYYYYDDDDDDDCNMLHPETHAGCTWTGTLVVVVVVVGVELHPRLSRPDLSPGPRSPASGSSPSILAASAHAAMSLRMLSSGFEQAMPA